MVDVSRVLKRPVVTEKSTGLSETGRYVFEVDPSATKLQIKQVVQEAFDVKVVGVNTMVVKGKPKALRPADEREQELEEGHSNARPGRVDNHLRGRVGMPLRALKPNTPGQRGVVLQTNDDITTRKPKKSLTKGMKRRAGRDGRGRISVRHRGGGHKRRYREIDFKRNKHGVPGEVATIEYDPNRSARIALIKYRDGDWRYILAPQGLGVGDPVMAGEEAPVRPGNALPLRAIPTGTAVHNIEMKIGRGGQMVRSAGGSAQVLAKGGGPHASPSPLGRGQAGLQRVHGHGGPAQRRRQQERKARQGGPEAQPGLASPGARRGHVPQGPSPRRWRGQVPGRDARTQDPLGQARARLPHPAQQVDEQGHRSKARQEVTVV